jgi:alanyl-tRNA synthetase
MNDNVTPYDETTLFCPSGMQQFKREFKDKTLTGKTISNIQTCIRLNDYDSTGDGTHFLMFNMIGLFSFRDMSVQQSISFWLEFLEKELSLKISWITIHPDKFDEWSKLYPISMEKRKDEECTWSDGEMGGYCTEFYIDGVEIGNIVNCNDDCIDVGFGLERLDKIVNNTPEKTKLENFEECIIKIIQSGYKPGPNKQGYILRKLLTDYIKMGGVLDHEFYRNEVERKIKMRERYEKVKDKFKDKTNDWWYETFGINLSEL